jgi:hypothetical protein
MITPESKRHAGAVLNRFAGLAAPSLQFHESPMFRLPPARSDFRLVACRARPCQAILRIPVCAKDLHTGWFVESLATQVLVIFLASRPSGLLAVTALLVVTVAVALPFTAIGGRLGFVPLPLEFFWLLGGRRAIAARVGRLVAASSAVICATVATFDSNAPATAPGRSVGNRLARSPIRPRSRTEGVRTEPSPRLALE